MANAITAGQYGLKNVPRSYQNYVKGELYGARPVTAAISNAGNKIMRGSGESLDSGLLGFMPVIGDALQAGQAYKDASQGNYLAAALGAGLLVLPDVVAKPVKKAVGKVRNAFNISGDDLYRAMDGLINPQEVQLNVPKKQNVSYPTEDLVRENYMPTISELKEYDILRQNENIDNDKLRELTNETLLYEPSDTQFHNRPARTLKQEREDILNEVLLDDYYATDGYGLSHPKTIQPKKYEIANLGGGYMLRSFMRGNPLEKQISKQGTVNVNNIRALANKGNKMEQAVVDKVLSSEEFAGKKAIDYNKFRKAVQDELITYDRTPDTRWQIYGMDRIRMSSSRGNAQDIEDSVNRFINERELEYLGRNTDAIPEYYDALEDRIVRYDDLYRLAQSGELETGRLPKVETFTFSSPRIPHGSNKHYSQNTLGHSRTYTTADEPDVLHVMESQSDWAQSGKATSRSEIENQIASLGQSLAKQEENLKNNGRYFAPKVRNDIKGNINYLKEQLAEYNALLKDAEQYNYLKNNYTSRQIQENLRYAAEKGQKKMRYPTRETAAKIEGYPEREAYFNEKGEEVTTTADELFTFGDKLDARKAELIEKMKALKNESLQNYGIDFSGDWWAVPDTERRRWNKNRDLYNKYTDELLDIVQGKKGEAKLKHGITKKTVYDYEDILRKYTEFPKQYQKLFNGADVRTVTDPKGNTWYEVDVPENYLNQEWQYAKGGMLKSLKL